MGEGRSIRLHSRWVVVVVVIVLPVINVFPLTNDIPGGYDGVERKSDFFALDLDTYTWTEMPCLGTPPSPRYFHSCCLYGGRMYLYGGYSGNDRLADMFAYDFDTNHWSVIDCTRGQAPSGRSSLVAQVHQVRK